MPRIACCLETTLPLDDPAAAEDRRTLDLRSEIAVEQALRIREQRGNVSITAFCVGDAGAERALRQALALGVNQAIQIEREKLDWRAQQMLLARAIAMESTANAFDLILLSNETTEFDRSDAPVILSEILDLPLLPNADQMEVEQPLVRAWCRVQDQRLLLECPFPAIVSVHPSMAVPRLPKLSQILAAKMTPLRVLGLGDLGLTAGDPLLQPRECTTAAFRVKENISRETHDGQNPDAIEKFAQALRERIQAASRDA